MRLGQSEWSIGSLRLKFEWACVMTDIEESVDLVSGHLRRADRQHGDVIEGVPAVVVLAVRIVVPSIEVAARVHNGTVQPVLRVGSARVSFLRLWSSNRNVSNTMLVTSHIKHLRLRTSSMESGPSLAVGNWYNDQSYPVRCCSIGSASIEVSRHPAGLRKRSSWLPRYVCCIHGKRTRFGQTIAQYWWNDRKSLQT